MNEVYHEVDQTSTKICIGCMQEKKITEFHRQGEGYRARCKPCRYEWDNKPLVITQAPLFIFERVCVKCGEEKKIEEFSKSSSHSYGHQTQCKKCTNEHMQVYYEETKEERQDYDRNRRDKAKRNENWNKRYQECYSLDPHYIEQKKISAERWRKANPLRYREYCLHYLAIKRQTTVERVDLDAIFDSYGAWCYICESDIRLDQKMEFDHIVPLKPRPGEPQGTHTADNIRPTHKFCNRQKSNIPFELLTPWKRRGPDKKYMRESRAIYNAA